ncbi:MAG: bifunctional ornithine acetyltransferase/N-acetylglutamate synthase, partial [Caldimicrobium sp.]
MIIPEGFRFSAVACGIRKRERLDLGLIYCEEKGVAWGVFTENTQKAAPVILGKKYVKNLTHRAIIVNSGVANACTGDEGIARAEIVLKELSQLLQVNKEEILPASTGVIGEHLPIEKILPALSQLVQGLSKENYLSF